MQLFAGHRQVCRHMHSLVKCPYPILHISRADVYHFGDARKATAVFKGLKWTIQPGEAWAIVDTAGGHKGLLLEMLLGRLRLSPVPEDGLYPFLAKKNPPLDPHENVAFVSFSARSKSLGGDFYDFTARYGAVRDEDRVTLRETVFPNASSQTVSWHREFATLAKQLDLEKLLDLPMVALSNGQTRRARIMKELLAKPELLILDEPLTGLDVQHRPKLMHLLADINKSQKPRIIMAMRSHDPLPQWITHVAFVDGDRVDTGPREDVAGRRQQNLATNPATESSRPLSQPVPCKNLPGKAIVSLKNVNVRYDTRHVLKDINWTIREGDKWHLQGANGSGKTTLLALITGDHPQSYNQSHLELFSLPRRRQPTTSLQRLIGSFSPELYNAFPRRLGANCLTVRDTIATGFESTFSYRPRSPEMDAEIDDLLDRLGPRQWAPYRDNEAVILQYGDLPFASLSSGEQALVLLLRALAGRPPLLILDEVFAGMDSKMVAVVKEYLRTGLDPEQAVIFVTHWEDEVPWESASTRKLLLKDAVAFEAD